MWLIRLNFVGKKNSEQARVIIHGLAIMSWIDCFVIPVFLVDVFTQLCFLKEYMYLVVGIILLASLPVELMVGSLLTYDFAYIKSNILQNRMSGFFILNSAIAQLSSIVFSQSDKINNSQVQLLSTFCIFALELS